MSKAYLTYNLRHISAIPRLYLRHISRSIQFLYLFMHKYRNNKLPASFSGIFLDTTTTDMMQSRHNDYNYQKLPAIKKILENFPFKQMIFNWNSLSLELFFLDKIYLQRCGLYNLFRLGLNIFWET